MKIKIVYGVDMRLWRYKTTDLLPLPSYKDLLSYVSTTFELENNKFRITFKDDDNEQITMTSQEDFHDAFTFAQKSNKKSLKLFIIDTIVYEQKESKESEPPIQSTVNNENENENEGSNNSNPIHEPTEEEINAFLNDDLTMDLLSDLFISVFEALQASNYSISFIECIKGVILSSNNKYNKLTESEIWPYFMDTLLPNISYKIEQFMIPMIQMNGIDANIIKQWIPKLFYIMKQGHGFAPFCGKFGRKHGRGHGHHHRGRHHKHHRGHRGRHRGGWRGRGRHGHHHGHRHGRGFGHGYGMHGFQPNYGNRMEDDEMEQEIFIYTEELVQIMNMGFTNMNEIKGLLNEHKGNKQLVVQELVLKQNK